MSNSIKVDLYEAVTGALKAMLKAGPDSQPLFQFVGHYNAPELETLNNFSYRTPAAFVSIDNIDWQETRLDQPAADLSREQNGMANVSVHFFIHDLRNDSDCYVEHLELINRAYRVLIGLRSTAAIDGKFSSMRRIREVDQTNFENLRHWQQVYASWVQEPPIGAERVDASPATVKLNIDVQP